MKAKFVWRNKKCFIEIDVSNLTLSGAEYVQKKIKEMLNENT